MPTSMTSAADWVALKSQIVFAITISVHAWRPLSSISGSTQVSTCVMTFWCMISCHRQHASVFNMGFLVLDISDAFVCAHYHHRHNRVAEVIRAPAHSTACCAIETTRQETLAFQSPCAAARDKASQNFTQALFVVGIELAPDSFGRLGDGCQQARTRDCRHASAPTELQGCVRGMHHQSDPALVTQTEAEHSLSVAPCFAASYVDPCLLRGEILQSVHVASAAWSNSANTSPRQGAHRHRTQVGVPTLTALLLELTLTYVATFLRLAVERCLVVNIDDVFSWIALEGMRRDVRSQWPHGRLLLFPTHSE